MEILYQGKNRIRRTINTLGATMLIAYTCCGNVYNLLTKTGHPSADIATGKSQPTALEKLVYNNFLGIKIEPKKTTDKSQQNYSVKN